ncbi:replication initiation protein [Rhizobium sp. Root1204]|uniref:replication initiation protein n=1 Tax=Rhizobium sp. Root1204 TaxID=1736428 RepID=UPI0007145B47|nr:replication initiation protein [Rhizobium sp. Root1204]KQV41936.1 hypothetical protein ASC96_00820 [Rhizobium sp. Root1204]
MPAPTFKNFIRRADRSIPLTGATRCGVHGDLKSLLEPRSDRAACVAVDMPGAMIKTIKYLSASRGESPAQGMGTKAHAMYEFLMAFARKDLGRQTTFAVPFADVKKFLQVDRMDRIREYMTAIGNTWVSYDFTDKDGVQKIDRAFPLLQCAEEVGANGKRHIRYSMHTDVRAVILAAKSYTWKEIAPFSKFQCKYAPRLYPILAYRAGMSFEKPAPLIINTEELASQLGWNFEPGKLKYSHFESRCLLPALKDIADHVKRFRVLGYTPIHGSMRGRPIIKISFTVSQAERPLEQRQKMHTTAAEKRILQALMERRGLSMQTEVPAIDTLARAATVLETSTIAVAQRWAEVLERAREVPALAFSSKGDGIDGDILQLLKSRGVGAAFELWLTDPEPCDPLAAIGINDGSMKWMQDVEKFVEGMVKPRVDDLNEYLASILDAA